jgi:oligopeptide/dipeptide ABC transporter ATP-binding protein
MRPSRPAWNMSDRVEVADAAQAPLLDVRQLSVVYHIGRRRPPVRAVDDVSFAIHAGETVGLVGESGSGKTTIGRAILGLAPVQAGTIALCGSDITHIDDRARRRLSADVQVVFQDPYNSLNPTRTIRQTLVETLRVHSVAPTAAVERAGEILERVGLTRQTADRYPRSLSGGQRQRVAIARALIARPRVVICDEPTSALDVSVQAQILNLFRELQQDLDCSYLFISHDLSVVRHVSHRIIVLYRGRITEYGDADSVYARPRHPYTQALLAAAPSPDPGEQRRRRLTRIDRGTIYSGLSVDDACLFAERCPHVVDICRAKRPPLEKLADGSLVSCHRWRELANQAPVETTARASPRG